MPRATYCCAKPSNRPGKPRSSKPSSSCSANAACQWPSGATTGSIASPNGLYNLSRLSVWWLRLGIAIERIKPGRPHENGRHERMHLTLKKEATRPPAGTACSSRPGSTATRGPRHETSRRALRASTRPYAGLPELAYPLHDRDFLVTACGRICMHKKKINISTVLAGQSLGIKEVDDGIWLVSFMHYDLGYIDPEQKTLQTIDNPFGTRSPPIS